MSKKKTTLSRRSFLTSAAVVGASGAVGVGGVLSGCSGNNTDTGFTPLRSPDEYYIPLFPTRLYRVDR